MSAFEELGVMPELIRAVEELGWQLPTPIQAEAVPLILGGGDLMAAAETGSGKTGAFALPVLQVVHETVQQRRAGKAGAGGPSGRQAAVPCALSAEERDLVLTLSPDGLRAQSRSERNWAGVRGAWGALGGRVYWEATLADEGLARLGWATKAASLDIGTDKHSFGYGGTGMKSHARSFEAYGDKFGKGDTVGCCLDCDAGTISFALNGRDLGVAFELPPHLARQALYPAVTLKNAEVAVNFGGQPWRAAPPAGYVGLAQAAPDQVTSGVDASADAGGGRTPTAIILEPARDLAEQTHAAVAAFARHLPAPGLSAALLVGGLPARPQVAALKAGVDIVTGTPARILDFVEGGQLATGGVKFFVLDEADRLLDTGNQETIMKLFARFPKGAGAARLQVLMFSATLHSEEVRACAARLCQAPQLVDLKGREHVPETVDHVAVAVDPRADRSWLQSEPAVTTDRVHELDATGPAVDTRENWSQAVKRLKPRVLQRLIDAHRLEQALIFCRTNQDCDNLEAFLNSLGGGGGGAWRGRRESGKENPYSCAVLAGQRSMDQRRAALQAFKDGDIRFLIATDVAARGLDISGLPYVINMTLPDRPEDYIHRVGRVGRADALGLAFSLVSAVEEKVWYVTAKGYKPWAAARIQPADVRANDQGGHTIWYNEPQLLKDIEARLKQAVRPLGGDLALPPDLAARAAAADQQVAEHLAALGPVVAELARLERDAQVSFFSLKRKWGAPAAAAR